MEYGAEVLMYRKKVAKEGQIRSKDCGDGQTSYQTVQMLRS